MQANKVLYRKYFPNSRITDAKLTILLNTLKKYYPGKDIKVVFKEMQQDNAFWDNFKAKYPHADVAKFHLDNTDVVRNIYDGDHWAWGETKHDSSAFSREELGCCIGKNVDFPKGINIES